MNEGPLPPAQADGIQRLGFEGLTLCHERLEAHFNEVRSRRAEGGNRIPVFALEHGLSAAELAVLKAEVCAAILQRNLSRDAWLPFVVYAAEVGYEYRGDEYWQTFEALAPGWIENGDRHYIRARFQDFKDRFHGAEPTGPWARHFSIICWPITHAVLPTDLQRQLARVLFEYRSALTPDLLADPDELGRRLAGRSWQASSRFQNFAQNTSLLGQVAVALLVGEDEESPYLSDSTLKRIVTDLSAEREAGRWLTDAKSSATRIRTRGFRTVARGSGKGSSAAQRRTLPISSDPDLFVRQREGGWTAYVELPDLSVLGERLPNVNEELGRLRARFQGVGGPIAGGRLLYPGQQFRLAEWPRSDSPLIQLENGSADVNALLADRCRLSPGPCWLFRIRESGFGTEVRGKFVRSGHSYVLLSDSPLSALPTWIVPAASSTAGVFAYGVATPTSIGPDDIAALEHLGIASVTEVGIRPAGFVPALWDGEGSAEWLAGEDPVIAIRSNRALTKCILTLDNTPSLVPWPVATDELFVRLRDLDVGSHELLVSLLPSDAAAPVAKAGFAVLIRSPHMRPATGTLREGLTILANPVAPTLPELWDGQAALHIIGPSPARANIEIALADRSNRELVVRRSSGALPIDPARWVQLFTSAFGRDDAMHRFYEEAESCHVAVTAHGVGTVTLRCERPFAPLRWAFGRDRNGPFVRLVDNTDGGRAVVRQFEFGRPVDAIPVILADRALLREPRGGLVIAEVGGARALMILPPLVRDLEDLRAEPPHVTPGPRSVAEVIRLIGLAHLWASASLPADPFASTRRLVVLRAITGHLTELVCGTRWGQAERIAAQRDRGLIASELTAAIGAQSYQLALAGDLQRRVGALTSRAPARLADSFAAALALHGRAAGVRGQDGRLAEFLLRLASQPSSLGTLASDDLRAKVELVLASPVLLRAARFLTLLTDGADRGDAQAANDEVSRWE